MKKITGFLMGLAMLFSLTSCVTAVHAQDDTYFDGEADVSVIVTYGTPYIVNGMIEYYLYKGWYYYPCWTNDSYYFHRYRRPLPLEHFRSWYRPIPAQRQKYHRPGHGYYHKYIPRHNNMGTHVRRPHGHINTTPRSGGHSRPRMGGRR